MRERLVTSCLLERPPSGISAPRRRFFPRGPFSLAKNEVLPTGRARYLAQISCRSSP